MTYKRTGILRIKNKQTIEISNELIEFGDFDTNRTLKTTASREAASKFNNKLLQIDGSTVISQRAKKKKITMK